MIKVEFDYKGKHYKGHFSEVSGAAARTWFLYLDNYYSGQMTINPKEQFVFTSQTGQFKELSDFFESVIIAYYE
jgi:hypothetical protein